MALFDFIKKKHIGTPMEAETGIENKTETEIAEADDLEQESAREEQGTEKQPEKKGIFARIKSGLEKTRRNISENIENVLKKFTKIDDDLFDELEEALILADIGVQTSSGIIDKVKARVKSERVTELDDVKKFLIDEITSILLENNSEFSIPSPSVILVIGVNGVGKTTFIGKLAANLKSEGKSVMLAAADTFRAAAIDQLEVWGERSGVPVIKQAENSDPAAVVFDAVSAAKARKADVLICDTAGRLQNKKNLMEELRKISKILDREFSEAHKEVFIVLDATTGQNALSQVSVFKEIAGITGIALTKLDGTAKGGIVIAIKNELNVPVRYIGVGEGVNDLQPFNAEDFAKALFD